MRSIVAAMLALLLLATPVFAAFDTAAVLRGEIQDVQQASCGNVTVGRITILVGSTEYSVFFNTNSHRAMILQYDTQGTPVEVAIGRIRTNGEVSFQVDEFLSFQDTLKRYPSPCHFLVEKTL